MTRPGEPGYVNAFNQAVGNDLTPTNFASCELASFESFYAAAKAASPSPVTPEFPSVYNLSDYSPWARGRYYGNVYAAPGATIQAVRSFQQSQTGHTTCSP